MTCDEAGNAAARSVNSFSVSSRAMSASLSEVPPEKAGRQKHMTTASNNRAMDIIHYSANVPSLKQKIYFMNFLET
jgi:hypothetical protein